MHPHSGEAGAIGAAFETLRVVTRRGQLDVHRPRCGDRPRLHVAERREHALPLLPEQLHAHVHRHAARPTAGPAATSPASRCEKGTVEIMEALKTLDARAQETLKQVSRTSSTTRRSSRSSSFYDAGAACPSTARSSTTSRSKRRCSAASKQTPVRRPFQRSLERERWSGARRVRDRHPARAQPLLDRARSGAPTSRRSASDASNVVFTDETSRGDVGRGRQVRLDRPVLSRRRSCQAHIHNLLFHKHTRQKPLNYIFFPCITHIPTFVVNTMDTHVVPDRRRHAEGDAARRSRRRSTSSRRAASSTSTRAVTLIEPNYFAAADVRDVGRAPRHHRGRERLRLPTRAFTALGAFDEDLQRRRAARSSSSVEAREPRRRPDARPPVPPRSRASTTASSTSSRRSAIRSSRSGRSRKDREVARRGSSRTTSRAASSSRRSTSRTCGRRTTRRTACRRCGRPSSRRAIRTSRARSVELQVRPRRADLRPDRQHHLLEPARRTRRCTTSTRTSRAGRSRSACKTYAHTLSLHEERLEDLAAKRSELQRRVEEKRQALMLDRQIAQAEAARRATRSGRARLEAMDAAYRTYLRRGPGAARQPRRNSPRPPATILWMNEVPR